MGGDGWWLGAGGWFSLAYMNSARLSFTLKGLGAGASVWVVGGWVGSDWNWGLVMVKCGG
jgi:hypothetical protein